MKILDIGHRGASGIAPENTIASFKEAIKSGADAVELDVHLTKDKKMVVIHDASIDRTSNGSGYVRLTNFKELRKYNYGTRRNPQKIPTLEEALKAIGTKVNVIVELKLSIIGHEKQALDIINKAKNKKKIWIHTSHKTIIRNIRKINKKIRVGYIVLLSFIQHLLLPFDLRFARRYNVDFFSVDEIFINKHFVNKFVKNLQKAGIKIYVWTVNDLNSILQSVSWGVDGIITNYPSMAKKVLKNL